MKCARAGCCLAKLRHFSVSVTQYNAPSIKLPRVKLPELFPEARLAIDKIEPRGSLMIKTNRDFGNFCEIGFRSRQVLSLTSQDLKEFIEFIREYKPDVNEAEYRGRKVKLGKPMRGDVKKFKVYVKNPKGNVVKVNFGQKGMNIKKNNPKRRKAFRARHRCDNPGPKTMARYWSCKKW